MSAAAMTGVSVVFPDGTCALSDVNITVPDGQRIAIVGASGSGKTTLARALFGLVPHLRGTVRVFGYNPLTTRQPRVAQLLFQHPRAMLHPAMSVRHQLRESARLFPADLPAEKRVDAVLEQVQLTHRALALPRALSGGELRRAGIARVLLASPRLLVADEPTTGLDAALKPAIAQLLFAPQRTTLLVTHDLGVAAEYTDRVVVLHHGQIIDDAPSVAALSHPVSVAMRHAAGVSS